MSPHSRLRSVVSRSRWWQALVISLTVPALAVSTFTARAEQAAVITFESPTYTTGNIHNQDGWSKTGAYDAAVVANTFGHGTFGSQTLRISNATTSGSFGDQTFSKSLVDAAGEVSAQPGTTSGGTRQSFFEAEWDFASTVPGAEQPGLSIIASPDRGDGARMAWIEMRDTPTGLAVNFQDYQTGHPGTNPLIPGFVLRNVASNLDRTVPHTIKVTMQFVEGPANDIVRVSVDGEELLVGASWEEYFRVAEGNPTRTVDSILFRASGPAAPSTSGFGFAIDNFQLTSSNDAPAAPSAVFVDSNGHDIECDGSTNATRAAAPDGACAFKTITRGYNVVASGGTVNIGVGTFGEAVTLVSKPVTFTGAGVDQTILDGGNTRSIGFGSTVSQSNLTIQDMTVQNFTQDGIHLLTGPLNNIVFEDLKLTANGRHGFASQANGINGLTLNRVDSSGNNPSPGGAQGGRGVWIINGVKQNVTVTNSTFSNNRLVGLDLADGTLENAIITGNTVANNGDSGMGILGPITALTVKNNTLTNNGRFGIEIKNPGGNGAGTPTLVVEENTITRSEEATDSQGRDYAGILVMRRDPVTTQSAVQPVGVLIQNNVVTGYRRKPASNSDGFGIVVAGTNMLVRNNIVDDNDVGIQVQAANTAADNSAVTGTDWFDRDSASSYSGVVEFNDIKSSNTIGLRGVGAPVSAADVENNWWGRASGPTNAANVGGTGASAVVSNGATIDFAPFLVKGQDTLPATIGFQPNADQTVTTVHVSDASGSDGDCNGSANVPSDPNLLGACAVKTIKKGVDLVTTPGAPNPASGIVSIASGTYAEPNIAFPNKDNLIVRGATSSPRPIISNGILLGTHTNLTLQDLDVAAGAGNAGADTVVISANGQLVTNLTMTNVRVNGENQVRRHGMARGQWAGTISITNSQFVDIPHWIVFDTASGGGGANIVSATFSGNTITNSKGHVNFRSPASANPTAQVTVTNNTWTGTGDFKNGATANLKIFYAATANITGNTFEDVGVDDGTGTVTNPPAFFAAELNFYGAAIMPRKITTLTIQNNLFENNNQAIAFEPTNPASPPGELLPGGTISNNTFLNNRFGIYIPSSLNAASNMAGLTVTENSFVTNVANSEAIHNGANNATPLPAPKNFWGNANGPTHATNPGGTGSAVSNRVAFSPWLQNGTDTSANIGFQPNLTPLGTLSTQTINVTPTSGLVTTENGGTAQFSVVLASAPSANVQVAISSDTPTEGTVAPASLTFTPANFNVPQVVTITGIASGAPNGNVPYTIITGAAVSTDPAFSGVDPPNVAVTNNAAVIPSVSIADVSANEGQSGFTNFTFNVTLSQASPRAASVQYATQPGTATAPADFLPANGTLTFAAGTTTQQVTVSVVGDGVAENNEAFTVNLSNATGATIADGQAVGTVTNDDDNGGLPIQACVPRPNIVVETQSIGGRQLQVTVKAITTAPNESNKLINIAFGTRRNATVQMPGQGTIGTTPITLPDGTRQMTFVVAQTNANASFHVPFSVNDTCGAVEKFVGGGRDAIGN